MTKKRRKSREHFDRHVRLHHWLMKSAAWNDLRPLARALLVHLYAMHNGVNNGELFLSVRDAAGALNVAPNTAAKGLAELEAHGFIRAKDRGHFSLKTRHATTWILTEFSYANQLAGKDFMRWQPSVEIQKPASRIKADGRKFCDRDTSRKAA